MGWSRYRWHPIATVTARFNLTISPSCNFPMRLPKRAFGTAVIRPIKILERARTDCGGACGPLASLSLGSPCGRPNRLRRFVEHGSSSVGGSNRRLNTRSTRAAETIFEKIARPDGFEPPTTWFEARCSIQLSYGRNRQSLPGPRRPCTGVASSPPSHLQPIESSAPPRRPSTFPRKRPAVHRGARCRRNAGNIPATTHSRVHIMSTNKADLDQTSSLGYQFPACALAAVLGRGNPPHPSWACWPSSFPKSPPSRSRCSSAGSCS